ncbi:MAG: extracellular solute-binding protein [Lachnospiraceae bacterium]
MEAATINDTLYAYPMTADNGYFLYYNKKYFSDSDVESLDKILEIANQNHKKFSMEWDSGWYLYAFFGNTGLDFGINPDGVTNHCNWNDKKGGIKGTDVAESLLAIASQPSFLSSPDGEFPKKVADGSVIAGVSGVWNAVELEKSWGKDLGAAKLPTYTVAGKQVQMASFTGYKMVGVSAYSKNPEWAAKLADWMTNEENQTLRFKERGQGPSNINASKSDAVSQSAPIQAVLAQAEFGKLQRVGSSFWDACTKFGGKMANGNPEKEDLQDIMDQLTNEITQSVAQ